MKPIKDKQKLDDGKGKKAQPRRVTPIFINPKASRIFGAPDTYVIDVERLLKPESKRPQKETNAFRQKCVENLESHLKELSALPVREKVLRWNGIESFTWHPDISIDILKAVLREPDWVICIPVESDLPQMLGSLDQEVERQRIHLGFTCHLSTAGAWEMPCSQLEKAKELGFKTYVILEYTNTDLAHTTTALTAIQSVQALESLQVNISLKPQGNSAPDALENIAQDIFYAFHSSQAKKAELPPISVKYSAAPEHRAWWVAQFAPSLESPFSAFNEYFEKANDTDWSDELKISLVNLLEKVEHSLQAKIERAYMLHKIRLLKPQIKEESQTEEDSLVQACKTVLTMGRSEIYRGLRTGKFLHLLEARKVSREKWPVRESHVRDLITSKMTPDQQVACWEKVADRYQNGCMTANQINKHINLTLVEYGIEPPSNPDSHEQLLKKVASISRSIEKQGSVP